MMGDGKYMYGIKSIYTNSLTSVRVNGVSDCFRSNSDVI